MTTMSHFSSNDCQFFGTVTDVVVVNDIRTVGLADLEALCR
jgi:hypothetical protein